MPHNNSAERCNRVVAQIGMPPSIQDRLIVESEHLEVGIHPYLEGFGCLGGRRSYLRDE
jgi:hypothetical protein